MPAFTFEKISPPPRRGSPPTDGPAPNREPKKPRGVIVQMLDRFVEARVKRAMPDGMSARRGAKPK
ncbi:MULTISPECIES: hypothetical protein [Rhodopseudomonas]|uniref:hypothetical protein n=1 Tax=Rhodopseudomonas TaxID=1073 RepID=UPI0009BC6F6C|nr:MULTISPECIES: hypothetical protein [Rhodopseudomonas]WOK18330.1 hypothetical protein RBJ75_02030 [Rhodopseudomonas sp. BAL398]